MCHHWTYDSVEERLAEREDEDEPEVEIELDREYREDRERVETPSADD